MDTIAAGVTGRKAFSIPEFCKAHRISVATYYNLAKEGKAPLTMHVGARRLISEEAAANWRRAMENEAV